MGASTGDQVTQQMPEPCKTGGPGWQRPCAARSLSPASSREALGVGTAAARLTQPGLRKC